MKISIYDESENVMKALAFKSRLQILECIEKGISNPGDIAKELKRQSHYRETLKGTLSDQDS